MPKTGSMSQTWPRDWCQDLIAAREAAKEDAGHASLHENPARYDLPIAQRLVHKLQERCQYSLDLTAADPSTTACTISSST